MLYVFQGCQAICWAPCRACDGLGRCCGEACGSCNRFLSGCLESCSASFGTCCSTACALVTWPLTKPLGGFFVLSLLFGVPIISYGVAGLTSGATQPQGCDMEILSGWQLALGAVHILSVLYIQCRLSSGLADDSEVMEQGTRAGLAQRAAQVVLYDIGFCLYIPLFAFSFGFGIWGISKSWACTSWGTMWASILLVTYGCCATAYLVCWICIVSCCGLAQNVCGSTGGSKFSTGTPQYGSQGTHASAHSPALVAQAVPPGAPATATHR